MSNIKQNNMYKLVSLPTVPIGQDGVLVPTFIRASLSIKTYIFTNSYIILNSALKMDVACIFETRPISKNCSKIQGKIYIINEPQRKPNEKEINRGKMLG
jgi:hypothetical protein